MAVRGFSVNAVCRFFFSFIKTTHLCVCREDCLFSKVLVMGKFNIGLFVIT